MMMLEEMDVFRLAHDLVCQVYRLTGSFPPEEKFGLVSQMRRASSSIPSNLMEGSHRIGINELRHFASIARGSCGELKYQLMLAKDLGYILVDDFKRLRGEYERVSMMLVRLHASLRTSPAAPG